ncbi:hypothetical protein EVAR_62113_1 [Eumeta japonica]|uniref:Uncharacterized protein n=1 Tax=Eumeta variegata TaxID=151549 RepID=A0A4C1Z6K4_EUMVA|nr:hypothetical protein EVAR_62113_1 [Eumeta japonica]
MNPAWGHPSTSLLNGDRNKIIPHCPKCFQTSDENKSRLRARFDDFPEYRTQFVEAYEALLATLNDPKPKREALLTKVDADFLRIIELADSIKLAFNHFGCGKESERTAGPSSSSVNSAVSEGLISCLPTLSLTQFSG